MGDIFQLSPGELKLLTNISFLSEYLEDFGIPEHCCFQFMGDEWSAIPFSGTLQFLIHRQRVQTKREEYIQVFKMANPSFTSCIVNAIRCNVGISVEEVAYNFIVRVSNVFPGDPSNDYLRDKAHELLLRRPILEDRRYGHAVQRRTKFSPLIGYLLHVNDQEAFALVNVRAVSSPGNASIFQLLARMYMHVHNYEEAYIYAQMAIDASPNNSFYNDTKGRVIIARMHQSDASERLIELLKEGLEVFSRCQSLSTSKGSNIINLAGFFGELKLIFTFFDILPGFLGSTASSIERTRQFLLTNDEIEGAHNTFLDHRQMIQKLQDRVEVALGHISDTQAFCEGKLGVKKQEFDSFQNDRKMFFCDGQFDGDGDRELLCRHRRIRVQSIVEPTMRDMFHLCRDNKEKELKEIQHLLNINDPKTLFDRKLLVWVSFALASMDAGNVRRRDVMKNVDELLKDQSVSLNGPFFNVLLVWPLKQDRDVQLPGRIDAYLRAERALKETWHRIYKTEGDSTRSSQSGIKVKPATHFFLGKGKGLRAFVHVSLLSAFSGSIEHLSGDFWESDGVIGKLVRLEGTLRDQGTLLYSMPELNAKVPIKLSRRHPDDTKQQRVSFFLGFSFAGPMAFHVRVL